MLPLGQSPDAKVMNQSKKMVNPTFGNQWDPSDILEGGKGPDRTIL